jgi:hypothetical protein
MSFATRDAHLGVDLNGDTTWSEGRVWDVRGADLADPSGDPLPEDASDPAVVDLDGDGLPGATVRVTGLLDGEIYVTQRVWTELEGIFTNAERLEGAIAWGEEQKILGTDNDILSSFEVKNVPVSGSFLMLKTEAADCDEILADRDRFFGTWLSAAMRD